MTEQYNSLPKLNLRTDSLIEGVDFCRATERLTFSYNAAGDTAEQPVFEAILKPVHIGQWAGLPLAAYLCVHSVFGVISAAANQTTTGFLIFRHPSGDEHTLASFSLNAGQAGNFQSDGFRLVIQTPYHDSEIVSLGTLRASVATAGAIVTTVVAHLDLAVYYGL